MAGELTDHREAEVPESFLSSTAFKVLQRTRVSTIALSKAKRNTQIRREDYKRLESAFF
jgi:hypothetical protein